MNLVRVEDIETCVQFNRNKVESSAVTLTTTILLLGGLCFCFFDFKDATIGCTIAFLIMLGFALPLLISRPIDRLYSKFPGIFSMIFVVLMTIYLAIFTSFFHHGISPISMWKWALGSMMIWTITFITHTAAIFILDRLVYKNLKISLTTKVDEKKVIALDEDTNIYRVFFYDYTSERNSQDVDRDTFISLNVDDVINISIQPRIDGVVVKSIKKEENFTELTDIEVLHKYRFSDKQEFDTKAVAKERNAMFFKFTSILAKKVWWLFALLVILGFSSMYSLNYNFAQVAKVKEIYIVEYIISFSLAIFLMYIEFNSFVKENDIITIKRWRDYLFPRTILYVSAMCLFINGALVHYDHFGPKDGQTFTQKYKIQKKGKVEKNAHGWKMYNLIYTDTETYYDENVQVSRLDYINSTPGQEIEVTFTRGALGVKQAVKGNIVDK